MFNVRHTMLSKAWNKCIIYIYIIYINVHVRVQSTSEDKTEGKTS